MNVSQASPDTKPTIHASSQRGLPEDSCSPGVVAVLISISWLLMHGIYYQPKPVWAAVLASVGLIFLAGSLRNRSEGKFRTLIHFILLGVLLAVSLPAVDRLLVYFEVYASPWEGVAKIAAPVLSTLGYPVTTQRGALHVIHPEGLVTILPSAEKLSIRPLAILWFLWVLLHLTLDGRRILKVTTSGALVILLVIFVRFALCLSIYLEHTEILVGSDGYVAISLFSSPVAGVLTLMIAGLMLEQLRRLLIKEVPFLPTRPLSARSTSLVVTTALFSGMLVGFTGFCDPPGQEKQGRILLDDRFCGVWEPTARLLDTEWYGDFSTYSFGSLAEWLGHWFVVDVNTALLYTDELLGRYDVLVLKTPVLPIQASEREAIDRFVTSGGGLLLIGDHTNLLGMGSHLNSLCDKYGLSFRYDSVSEAASGGFVDYYGHTVGRSVGALNVDHLQFMTSCSLDLDFPAEPILVGRSCKRDPHDYAGHSFFGGMGPHPELAHGTTVLAASVPAGKGKITAFTDSTVWSSFAVFQFDREKLAADLLTVLNRTQSSLKLPFRVTAFLTSIILLFIGFTLWRTSAFLPFLTVGILGGWCGIISADKFHEVVYDRGPPLTPIHETAFLWAGGNCAFPAVLGGTGSLDLDNAYDTLFVSVQRLGLVPRVAYTYGEALKDNTKVLFVIAPIDHPPKTALTQIDAFVRNGGMLVVMDDGRLSGNGSARDYLWPFGIDLTYTHTSHADGSLSTRSVLNGLTEMKDVPSSDTFVGHKLVENGHVVYMREATSYSRNGMKHCFARPGRIARARYDSVFWLIQDVLKLKVEDRRFYGILD